MSSEEEQEEGKQELPEMLNGLLTDGSTFFSEETSFALDGSNDTGINVWLVRVDKNVLRCLSVCTMCIYEHMNESYQMHEYQPARRYSISFLCNRGRCVQEEISQRMKRRAVDCHSNVDH
jgi:hypothetical protein